MVRVGVEETGRQQLEQETAHTFVHQRVDLVRFAVGKLYAVDPLNVSTFRLVYVSSPLEHTRSADVSIKRQQRQGGMSRRRNPWSARRTPAAN